MSKVRSLYKINENYSYFKENWYNPLSDLNFATYKVLFELKQIEFSPKIL